MVTPLREIDGASFGDLARFRVEVAEHCEPVIARNLVSDWPVLRAANASPRALRDYLGRFAEGSMVGTFIGAPEISGRYSYGERLEGFNFERRDLALLDALDHVLRSAAQPDAPTYYAGSLDTDRFLPGFSAENRVAAVPPTIAPRIWIGNAGLVECHNDTFDNIAIVVAGRRRFTLYPPDAIADLYIGPIDHTMAGRPTSLAAASRSFDPRYPRFEKVRGLAMAAELGPGDAIYIPKLWWHQVEATAPFNILVNYWWDAFSQGPDAPYTSLMLALIAIAERPPAERAAWRALFDHYVFRPDGHPLAHLPEAQHGILGPVRSNYGRIRAIVMQMLRGA
jgi:hypothetical protein